MEAPLSLLHRHLLRATFGPFLFGLFVITFVLIIDILYRYVELFVSKGVPFPMATEVLILSLGHTFALSIPMAVLVGVLMGVGQLAADHEITALKASGVGLYQILMPLLGGALVIAIALTAYNHYVFPESNHRLANLIYDINHKRPMLEIREQMFTDLNDDLTIFVREKDDLTNRITGVVIIEKDGPGDPAPTMTTAERGMIIPLHDTDAMRIELEDGEIHELPDDTDLTRYSVTRFKRHHIHLTDMERDFRDSDRTSRGDREMNITQLLEAARLERENRDEAVVQNLAVADDLAERQWSLLDPERRDERAGRRNTLANSLPVQRRRALLKATRQEVARSRRAADFQDEVLQSYHARESRYMVEVHKKIAIPVACIVFVLVGLPMAVTTARSGRGVSMSLALVLYLVYYLFLVRGEHLADRGKIAPAIAMWSANVVLTCVGIVMLMRAVRDGAPLRLPFRHRHEDTDIRPPETTP